MKIEQIMEQLQKLNASAPAEKKAAKKVQPKPQPVVVAPAAAAPKTNGHTHLSPDEMLKLTTARIVRAMNLKVPGASDALVQQSATEALVAMVRKFEEPYVGVVQ